jgi:hypothetical protein
MQFMARWGNACGIDFKKDAFCDLRKEWDYQRDYLEDRLTKPWVVCSEVNISKQGHLMSSAIKEYQFVIGSASNTNPLAITSLPNTLPPLNMANTVAPQPPAIVDTRLTNSFGGTQKHESDYDNKKELKDFNKMFKKQNKKSHKANNSNTRRNKRK